MRIEMPEKRKKYDREFREGAVRIVEETGKPIAQVARDLGVVEGTLGNWVKQARESRHGSSSLSKDDYAELQRLRGEVAELRMERDVLSDPWSCGSRRRRSERGTLHRRPEDHLPGATQRRLRPAGGQRGLVLQVARQSPGAGRGQRSAHADRSSPRHDRPRRAGRVRQGAGSARFTAADPRPA